MLVLDMTSSFNQLADLAFVHKFVRAVANSVTASSGGPFTSTKAVILLELVNSTDLQFQITD